MPELLDGTGSGFRQKVNAKNRAYTDSVSATTDEHGTLDGDSYNINTGLFSITGTAAHAILYVKNNENADLLISAIAIGVGTRGATITDAGVLTLIKNPTGGDLLSDKTSVDMNQNRNFGSSKTLTVDAYKGKNGGTVTGGDDAAKFIQSEGRLFAGINIVVPKGNSVALTYDPNTSGSVLLYAAFVCHLQDLEA